jgi:hypothetical protein
MNWDPQPQDSGGFAGDFRAARPRFESPLSWSLPLVRLGSVSVRVHAAFLLFIAVECLRASLPGLGRSLGFVPTLEVLGSFLALSMLHEAARWLALRRAGWDLDEWLLWPLGGLSTPGASEGSLPSLRAEAAGFAALAGVGVIVGGTLYALRGDLWGTAIPEPWTWDGYARLSIGGAGALVEVLFLLQWTVVVMLLLNAIPAFPLDAGRAFASRCVAALGWSAGLTRASRVGTASSVVMLVGGLALGAWTLTFASLLLWIAARETLLRVADSDAWISNARPQETRSEAEPGDQAELDRILEKINRQGMESLNFLERRRLRAATKRRRDGGGPIR